MKKYQHSVLQQPTTVLPTLNQTINRNLSLSDPSLRCLYTNATSLINKWDEFNSRIITEGFPNLIMVTETWFKQNSIINIDNYTLFNKNRVKQTGGGVAIYVRNDVEAYEANHIIGTEVVAPLGSSEKNHLHAVLVWDLIISSKNSKSPIKQLVMKNGNYEQYNIYD